MKLLILSLLVTAAFAQKCEPKTLTCEWKYQTFKWSCPPGQRPKAHVFWGRDNGDNTICVDGVPKKYLQKLDCPSNETVASKAFEKWCNAHAVDGYCTIRAANRKLGGDPCRGTFKYMRACVECVPAPPVACPKIYAPVCGSDGKTYLNKCLARNAGVKVEYERKCSATTPTPATVAPPPCVCSKIYSPVCGADGKTYPNGCRAKCAGVEVSYKGKCAVIVPSTCICTAIYAPVCGADGKTYSNECRAKCAGVEVASLGECAATPAAPKKPCACPRIYKPVCGKNGETYANACMALCSGVSETRRGKC